jgi:signal transduction histidine kinase
MRERRAGALWLLAWCGPALLVAYAVMLGQAHQSLPRSVDDLENVYPNLVFGSLVPLLGALILSRLPGHALGRLFLACGLASALTLAVYVYAWLGLHGEAHRPGTVAAAWVSEWIWGLGFTPLVTIGILLFPDGRPPGPRWRLLLWSDLAGVVLVFVANAFHPGRLVNHGLITNPLGLPLPRQLFTVLGTVGFGLFALGLVGGVAATLVRLRRAQPAERAQLTWFACAAGALAVAVLTPVPLPLAAAMTVLALPLLPISVAVAILRHQLYGIEPVIRRSLVYATLTVLLLATYAVTVAALGAVFGGRADTTVTLVATALVAVGFAPVRSRLQRAADRLLYGERSNPYAVLTGVGRRLDVGPGTDALAEIAETVATSLRLPYVRVELRGPATDDEEMVAAWGRSTGELHEVALSFRGERVGSLRAAPRTPLDPFRAADLRLLEDLGRQVGVAAHAMLLTRDLQRSREALVTLREEERRRIRRDLHDGLGPALAGVALGLDAVDRLVREQPEEAARLAVRLRTEVQDSLADVRRLVEDLRPAALDQLGLVGAVRRHGALLTERDHGLEVAVEDTDVPALSAAVEVAAYRIVTEALNNVSRHAVARRCRVGIGVESGAMLVIDVEDDGVGLTLPVRSGVGLAAMRERAVELGGSCEVAGLPTGGTRVAARIPLVTA